MTDTAKELLALADAYLANNAAETGADELIRQLRAALPAAPGEPCAVKPLEWVERRWLIGVDDAADAILAALDGGR